MKRASSRFKVRHLLYAWLAYWTTLTVWALSPAALVLGKLSRDGAHGDASAGISDGLLNVSVTSGGTTRWAASVSLSTLALALAVPPILLWCWWLFTATSQPDVRPEETALLEAKGDAFSGGAPFGGRASGDPVRQPRHHTPA